MPDRMTGSRPSRPTIDDVAREAGVSTATVSRALRDHHHVSDDTRRRVLDAAASLKYVANPNASRLASGLSRTIGLLAPLLSSWYTRELISGMEDVLEREQYDLLIGTANALARERTFVGDTEFRQRVDGVLLVDVFCGEEAAEQLAGMDVPTVVLGERLRAVSSLAIDNRLGAQMATRHLIGHGHRRIALVGGLVDPNVVGMIPGERTAGFEAAMVAAGLAVDPALVVDGNFTISGGYRAAQHLLSLAEPPTGVFCMSDEMAFGVLQAAREAGVSGPAELSVVGFDDHPVSEAFGLTTIRQPVREMGRIGARVMLDHVEGEQPPTYRAIPIELVARASTGAAVSVG